ncbi:MAG: DUF4097 family beta strand repeat protein [Chloroflexi bacterium]|nr:DUF4097 family beta strand repeat protein [Chloroflexota bacterium]MBI3168598.1 DUF4097 family beta strand repeat protein [Chloroflexota bacterium]
MKRPLVIALLVIALVFVLTGIGAVLFFAVNNGFAGNSPFDRNNISSIVEESKTLKVDAEKPVTLKVADDAGDVTVTGGDVKTVQVKIIKTAYDSTQAHADAEVKTIPYSIEQNGNAITLKYELPKSMNFSNNINTVDFIVTVPKETMVTIDTNYGSVAVSDIQGDADLTTDFGDLFVENLDGSLSMDTNNGDAQIKSVDASGKDVVIDSSFGDITLEQVKSRGITVTSSNGKITFTNVRATGDVFTKSSFGDINFENGSAATLTLDSDNGRIEVTKFDIKKELGIDNSFGDIVLTSATAGSYDIHTSNGNLTIDGVKGTLKAYTDFGDIEIINARSVVLELDTNNGNIDFSGSLGEGPHNIRTDFGDVTLSIPDDSNLSVDLTTEFGDITSDIPITVTLTGDLKDNEQTGSINEGGGLLTIDTNNGDIHIKAIK